MEPLTFTTVMWDYAFYTRCCRINHMKLLLYNIIFQSISLLIVNIEEPICVKQETERLETKSTASFKPGQPFEINVNIFCCSLLCSRLTKTRRRSIKPCRQETWARWRSSGKPPVRMEGKRL